MTIQTSQDVALPLKIWSPYGDAALVEPNWNRKELFQSAATPLHNNINYSNTTPQQHQLQQHHSTSISTTATPLYNNINHSNTTLQQYQLQQHHFTTISTRQHHSTTIRTAVTPLHNYINYSNITSQQQQHHSKTISTTAIPLHNNSNSSNTTPQQYQLQQHRSTTIATAYRVPSGTYRVVKSSDDQSVMVTVTGHNYYIGKLQSGGIASTPQKWSGVADVHLMDMTVINALATLPVFHNKTLATSVSRGISIRNNYLKDNTTTGQRASIRRQKRRVICHGADAENFQRSSSSQLPMIPRLPPANQISRLSWLRQSTLVQPEINKRREILWPGSPSRLTSTSQVGFTRYT
ncbi:hypothetical protein RRG08_010560 [Elysia crispata]|uniref:Uncharacterized protein n=1 Tax=Elysia crispata TaxID=231223 RepID=A0AAE0ZVG4_9GAST|nr:hypothetical protein RRG08_010560 [Elysia crispata]